MRAAFLKVLLNFESVLRPGMQHHRLLVEPAMKKESFVFAGLPRPRT
jgi:hypothetical protein